MSNRRRLPPAVIDALGEIVAAGVASGMIDRYIPVRDGFIDAAAPGEPARIAAHLAASPDAPEWAAVHEPLATLLRRTPAPAGGRFTDGRWRPGDGAWARCAERAGG